MQAQSLSTATLDETNPTPYAARPKIGASPHDNRNHHNNGDFPPTTITLTPIATPAALGLSSYAAASFVIGAFLTGWYGDNATVSRIWPFVLFFGGFGSLAAGMWSFVARDNIGSLIHTIWGSFWFGLAINWALMTVPTVAGGNPRNVNIDRWGMFENFAIWLIPVAALSFSCALALFFRELLVASIWANAGTAAVLAVIGWFIPSKVVLHIAGYLWLSSSLLSLYRVWVYFMHEATRNDHILPILRTKLGRGIANGRWTDPAGEPGVVRDGWKW